MPDPVQNALAAQPSNNLAYIGLTPRNRFLGGIADFLGQAYSLPNMPRMGVPGLDFMAANRNRLLDMLGVGDVQKTAEALSYGNRIGTGAGMTYQPLPETLGAAMAVAPMVVPAARMAGEGAMATGRFVAPKAGQLAEQYMVRTGGILPLDVYHGTPHTLPPTPNNPLGEFDASKIGTGEGAQVYGHGIYVAESPAVATGYREKLSKNVKVNGEKLASIPSDSPLAQAHNQVITSIQNGMTPEEAIAHSQQYWINAASEMEAMKSAHPELASQIDSQVASRRSVANAASKLNPASFYKEPGNLYKVDLPDEKIAKMLDYDKHLSEQSKAVQNILLPYQKEIGGSFGTGEQTLKAIAFERRMKGLDDSPAAVAQQLKEMGIPGVQYLDAGSRNVAGGTRNFVVFPGEEKSMTILERNGQPAQMSVADQIDNINEVLKKKRKK
jgi:hypothetical protein